MPKVIFAAQSSETAVSPQTTGERLINCYAEPQAEGARSPLLIRPTLIFAGGTAVTSETSETFPDAITVAGTPYFLSFYAGTTARLYSVSSSLSATALTTVSASLDSRAVLASSPGFIVMADDGPYNLYSISGNTWSAPGSGAFTNIGSATYLAGYIILSEFGGRRFEWTAIGDPTTRNALNFATKEARDDNVRRVAASQGRLYVIGERSTEIWFPTGSTDETEAFAQVSGAVYDVGALAKNLVRDAYDRLFMISDDYKLIEWAGGQYRVVSPSWVDAAIRDNWQPFGGLAEASPTHLLVMEDRGRKLICIRLAPSGVFQRYLCYDITTGLWHERDSQQQSAVTFAYNTIVGASVVSAQRSFDVLGGLITGAGFFSDIITMISRPLDLDGEAFRVASLEFRVQPPSSGDPIDFGIVTSRDGGETFTSPGRLQTIPAGGSQRMPPFRSLGRFRQFTCKAAVSGSLRDFAVEAAAILKTA